jgi:hypothetical protein
MGKDPDPDLLERLERNVRQAEDAYRDEVGFEQAIRALGGLREAIRQRITATRSADAIEVPIRVMADGKQLPGEPALARMTSTHYWRGVPRRFQVVDTYAVVRSGVSAGAKIHNYSVFGICSYGHFGAFAHSFRCSSDSLSCCRARWM